MRIVTINTLDADIDRILATIDGAISSVTKMGSMSNVTLKFLIITDIE
jgi:hypothetical protein